MELKEGRAHCGALMSIFSLTALPVTDTQNNDGIKKFSEKLRQL